MVLNLDIVTTGQKSEGPLLGSQLEAGLESTVKKRYDEAVNIVLKEHVLFLGPTFWRPMDGANQAQVHVNDVNDEVYYGPVGMIDWAASIPLEKGATITEIRVYAYDSGATQVSYTWYLSRSNMDTYSDCDVMCSGTALEVVKKIIFATLDTEKYCYTVRLYAGSVFGAVIKYKL